MNRQFIRLSISTAERFSCDAVFSGSRLRPSAAAAAAEASSLQAPSPPTPQHDTSVLFQSTLPKKSKYVEVSMTTPRAPSSIGFTHRTHLDVSRTAT
jgi:hypothetical protein